MNRADLWKLVNVTNRMDGLYYRLSKLSGVSENTAALLYALSDGKHHTQKEIADNWMIPRTTLNSVVKAMVKDGYMLLTAKKGKEKVIELTSAGSKYADEVLAPMFKAEQEAMNAMKSNAFIEELEKFTEAFEKATEETEKENN